MPKIGGFVALAFALIVFGEGRVLAAGCDPDEIKVGEDRFYVYCMKKNIVTDCQRKGGNVGRCVNAGCVRSAGEELRDDIGTCSQAAEDCLAERGASTKLISAIVACIASAAADHVEACFGATVIGGLGWDEAHYICKSKFGDCVQPKLRKQRNFVTFCGQYGAQP